jgi:peptidoglycan/xylan/chitin deacetylase (PgdA/CDA1 family)
LAALSAMYLYVAFYQVPILMYHQVAPNPQGSGLIVTPETFERQMEFLKIHKYRVLTMDELVGIVRKGGRAPFKSVVITFDDGFADNFDNAFPVLRKMGFPATIYMITDNIGLSGWLSEEDLRILDGSDVEIGSHTLSHAFIPKIEDAAALEAEIFNSKRKLEEILGHPVDQLSYPGGGYTLQAAEMAEKAGYVGAVTTNHGKKTGNPYGLHRVKIRESGANLFNFWLKTTGLYHIGKKRIPVK